MAAILAAVSSEFCVDERDILGPWRLRDVAIARQVVCWLARKLTYRSFPSIGLYMDRDHTTVMHAYDKIEQRRKTDAELLEQTDRLLGVLTP